MKPPTIGVACLINVFVRVTLSFLSRPVSLLLSEFHTFSSVVFNVNTVLVLLHRFVVTHCDTMGYTNAARHFNISSYEGLFELFW